MDTFKFENFKRTFDYQNNSDAIQLGNGYSFISKPRAPMLKLFHVVLTGMRYYFTENGEIDYETNKYKDNLGAFCQFYEEKGTYEVFILPDEQFGNVHVRFKEPLKVGETKGRRAVVPSISIELQETSE